MKEIIPIWFRGKSVYDFQRDTIMHALVSNNQNRTKTAKELHMTIRTLRNRIDTYRSQGYYIPESNRGNKAAGSKKATRAR